MASASQNVATTAPLLPIPGSPATEPIRLSAETIAKLEASDAAFLRELPALLVERPGQWVAYLGEQRLGFARQRIKLYRLCREQSIDEKRVLFCLIEPPVTEISMGPGYIEYSVE